MDNTHSQIIALLNQVSSLLEQQTQQHDQELEQQSQLIDSILNQEQEQNITHTEQLLIDSYKKKHSLLLQQITLLTQLTDNIYSQSESLHDNLKENLDSISQNQEHTIQMWSQLEFLDAVNP